MDEISNREGAAPEKNAVSVVPQGAAAAQLLPNDPTAGIGIDFHSAEFNRTDDLNDYSGNYRSFQPLGDVITADMRHQLERRRQGAGHDPSADAPASKSTIRTAPAGAEVREAPAALTVISRGRTLILAPDTAAAIACGRRLGGRGLNCTVVSIRKGIPEVAHGRAGGMVLLEADAASVKGAFGGFSATVAASGGQKDLGEWLDGAPGVFDLVLDLQPVPSFTGTSLPLGYYAPGPDPARIDEAMAELPEMRGRFHKPQFVAFRDNRCTRGRSRRTDCQRCFLVCPYGAITPLDRKVSINHYLCQGCGGCVTVCPAEAIRRIQPAPEELRERLERLLSSRPIGGDRPTLIISADFPSAGDTPGKAEERHPGAEARLEVEHIGQVGLEVLLAALAYGAGRVLVASKPQDPPAIREAVQQQAEMAGAILGGLGMPEGSVRFVSNPGEVAAAQTEAKAAGSHPLPGSPATAPPPFSSAQDRRTAIRQLVQHLADRSGAPGPWLPLPAGSPFGTVTVAPGACTLCMACVAACPAGALVAAGDLPRLDFIEARCHQCGLCEEACPEDALGLEPRMLCDRHAAERPRVLHEAEPFRCVQCGTPFATRAMVDRMRNKLTGHWMYGSERQLHRLQMCGTCRTADALVSEDMSAWSRR